MTAFLYVLHFMVCIILILVVLLQRGKGSDMGAALGGGGGNTVFGARGAGNFLSKITTASAAIFMMTSLSLAYFNSEDSDVRLFDGSEVTEARTAPGSGGEDGDEADSTGELTEVDDAAANTLQEIPPPSEAAEAGENDAN